MGHGELGAAGAATPAPLVRLGRPQLPVSASADPNSPCPVAATTPQGVGGGQGGDSCSPCPPRPPPTPHVPLYTML
ncbi:hypothetical protein EYF80_062786 [Liparis tanakae]|uniref:Uncharacterized protein n=1 Tax=Liparis tanakae TaxID=230148 RepID=A0A4Z2EFI4_9TELE|nr:hypothetical protein EYF80_062786 [Liparis tanakae]